MSSTDKPNPAASTSPKNTEEAFAQMIGEYRLAMSDFHEAMKMREDLSVRIGKRTTQIIRFSMIGMSIMAAAMFALIYTLTGNMQDITAHMIDMSGYMKNMSMRFDSITTDMQAMRTAMETMNQNMYAMPEMNQSMSQMSTDMANMNHSFGILTNQVGAMTYDVDRMSSPMHFFPMR